MRQRRREPVWFMTLWGGTPDYTCQLTVPSTHQPRRQPLRVRRDDDMNGFLSRIRRAPTVPAMASGCDAAVPGGMLCTSTNGSTNTVTVVRTTPDNFDGRMQHVTLVAVYQSSALTNEFDYALAERAAAIYTAYPRLPKSISAPVVFGGVQSHQTATAAHSPRSIT